MVNLSLKILAYDRTRFLSTVWGVAFAVTLVLVQIGIFLGMLDGASITIDRADADLWVTARNTPNVDFANTIPETYVQRVRSVPGVLRAGNLIVWFIAVALPSGAKESAIVYGLEDFPLWGLPWSCEGGDPRDLHRGRSVILDDAAERRFGPFAIGEHREFLGIRLKIIGRSHGARSFTTNPLAFVDYRIVQAMASQELHERTTFILVKLEPGADREVVRTAIRRRLPYNDVWTRDEWSARSREYWVRNTGLGLGMYVSVFLGGLVGVVVVAQTLHSSTIEHFKEFAAVKAIGGRNIDIYRIIAEQAAIAALIGFAVGFVLAHSTRPLLEPMDMKLILTPRVAADVFIGTLVLCLVASAMSFRRIATLDPATILRG